MVGNELRNWLQNLSLVISKLGLRLCNSSLVRDEKLSVTLFDHILDVNICPVPKNCSQYTGELQKLPPRAVFSGMYFAIKVNSVLK